MNRVAPKPEKKTSKKKNTGSKKGNPLFRPLADYNSEEESIDSILSSINKRLKRREDKDKKKNMEITAEKEKTQTKVEKTKVNDDQKTKDIPKKKETKRRSKNISESLKPAITKDQSILL